MLYGRDIVCFFQTIIFIYIFLLFMFKSLLYSWWKLWSPDLSYPTPVSTIQSQFQIVLFTALLLSCFGGLTCFPPDLNSICLGFPQFFLAQVRC